VAKHKERVARRRADKAARADCEFTAKHKWARMAGSKVRLVADQVRGQPINRVLEQLSFSNRRAASLLDKVVRSALANAEQRISERKLDLDVDDLVVSDVHVDRGPYLKRWMTRARGMAFPILKHSCHISVTLSPAS